MNTEKNILVIGDFHHSIKFSIYSRYFNEENKKDDSGYGVIMKSKKVTTLNQEQYTINFSSLGIENHGPDRSEIFFRDSKAFVLVYDSNKKMNDSFEKIKDWISEIKDQCLISNPTIVVIESHSENNDVDDTLNNDLIKNYCDQHQHQPSIKFVRLSKSNDQHDIELIQSTFSSIIENITTIPFIQNKEIGKNPLPKKKDQTVSIHYDDQTEEEKRNEEEFVKQWNKNNNSDKKKKKCIIQ